jgi:DNA primase
MLITRDAIARVKTANDLCEVAREQGIALRRRGRTYFGLCPFHGEQTASFAVSRDAGLFHCFGCGAGGDVIRFVERTQQVSFPEAVRRLARRAGLTIDANIGSDDR